MGKYRINAPVVYLEGRKVVQHTRPHDEAITIDDETAKQLGDAVSPVGEEKPDTEGDKGNAEATASQQASKAAQSGQRGAQK